MAQKANNMWNTFLCKCNEKIETPLQWKRSIYVQHEILENIVQKHKINKVDLDVVFISYLQKMLFVHLY